MVIDTSALVAMLSNEPEAQRFEAAVEADRVRLMSAASYRKRPSSSKPASAIPGAVNWISGCTGPRSIWSRSTQTRPRSREWPTASTARGVTARG
jgi:hypothetical protein